MSQIERSTTDAEVLTQAFNPLAAVWQNTWVVREAAERFANLGYLHEVIVKCLAVQAYGRLRAQDKISAEVYAHIREPFRQPSTGHWATLYALCQKELLALKDRPSSYLDGLLRKKLRDEPILRFDQHVTELLGHTERNKTHVTLAELLQSMIEMRNKTRGHGAPRRSYFEEINPLFEASLLLTTESLRRYLWSELVYIEEIKPEGDHILLEGQRLAGLLRHHWQATYTPATWLQPYHLYWLERSEDGERLYPLDPLLVWDRRHESVGFFNGYTQSKQQMEYLSYGRGATWHERSRTYEQAFTLPSIQMPERGESMKTIKLWSNKGVALYPVDFPLVGQNAVYNGLFKFKQAFLGSQANDIAGFFALIGDWGLGKTRIGYELFAQLFNHIDRWVLNQDDFIVANGADGRLLQPQLGEGILPLYIRYDMVCDANLFADNWVARITTAALKVVINKSGGYDIPAALVGDLRAALNAKGVDFSALAEKLSNEDADIALAAAMKVLNGVGIQHLWVVVDEVETLSDRQRGLREDEIQGLSEDYLDMVSTVIKHENYRQAHPYVNFLVLCSLGMRDKIDIGPNRRRTHSVTLEPNRIGDVHTYVNSLRERAETLGQTVDYPPGTLEGAFIACNCNFGWFNVMMSSIHESYRMAHSRGQMVTAWQLLEDFARAEARAKWIFDLSILDLLSGLQAAPQDIVKQLIFGQLPIALTALNNNHIQALKNITLPGIGPAFTELTEIHLNAATLATELVRPEIGFKPSPLYGGSYLYSDSEISLTSLLGALRAFSVGITKDNFLICWDLNAFVAQLSALYERPNVDIALVAEPLHSIFLKYEVKDQQYLGPSFALLQRLDTLLKRSSGTTAFLQDANKDAALEKYTQEIERSEQKRRMAICQGFVRLLDANLATDASTIGEIQSGAGVFFTSSFQSPRLDGLQVTPEGRVTIVYGQHLEKIAQELGNLIGQVGVHPIILLLPSGYTAEDWQRLTSTQRVQLCVLARGLTRVEEAFLVKLSGKGKVFQAKDILSGRTLSIRGNLEQTWQRETQEWRDKVEQRGYLLRPLWHSKSIAEGEFARGYRLMLVNDWNIDQLAPDVYNGFDNTTFDRIRKACQYNADPGPGQEPLLAVITQTEPYTALVPPAFGALLYELKSQATLDVLQRRFFFAVSEKKAKATKQLEQILNLLRELGLVTLTKTAYRAVDAQTLKDYRQATSTWLNGECQRLLVELDDTFTPETVGQLRRQSTNFIHRTPEALEQAAKKADFSVLDAGANTPASSILNLVKAIADIENTLQSICPPGIYQQSGETFDANTSAIAIYEQHLMTYSLWKQVHFFHWLRQQYRQRCDQLAHAIQEQLAQSNSLQTIDGQPFPISPLTIPLKSMLEELTAAASSGLTLRNVVPVPGYPDRFRTYIYMRQYDNAWHRLDALSKFVERAQPTAFWARFEAARKQWTTQLSNYQHARSAWDALSRFMGEANAAAWAGAKAVRARLDQWQMLIEGGLVQAVNAEATSQEPEKLIDALEAEVQAADKYRQLPQEVGKLRQEIEAELKALIDELRLQALGRLLTAKRRSQLTVPPLGTTYAETKAAFEAFNMQVVETGKRYFEADGKQTTWEKWLEIYTKLRGSGYTIAPEDELALRDLEEMRLIERTVRLR